MPINYARRLTGRQREPGGNRHLGMVLAFVAGAANAGGFIAVRQYTSHMTGIVPHMADDVATGAFDMAAGLGALAAFAAGAACCALMVNHARRRELHSMYAPPLLFEAVLPLSSGMPGTWLAAVPAMDDLRRLRVN